MLFDLHVHQLTKGMFNLDDRWGPFWDNGTLRIGKWVLGTKRAGILDLDENIEKMWAPAPRIKAMDDAGHDKWVVSIPSHMVMYHTDPAFGVRHAQTVNDSLAEYCATNPDRFYFWAHAPLQDPQSAAKELDRAVTQLGAKGLEMGGANFGGLEADDPALDPVWEKICELGVPVFCHGYNQSVGWDEPMNDPYDTTSIIGMNSDEALFYWYVCNGGVLDRFPDLKLLITHGGGFVPFQLGRFEATNLTMAPDSKNKKPFTEYRKNFYYDLDIHSPIMRRAIIDAVGIDQVVYGDNFGGADGHRVDLTDKLGLTDDQREQIRSTNVLKLVTF
jgi:aminocarboxymuconate-semialdehyde decarboxylase